MYGYFFSCVYNRLAAQWSRQRTQKNKEHVLLIGVGQRLSTIRLSFLWLTHFAPYEPLSKILDMSVAAAYLVYTVGINTLCPTIWTQKPATLRQEIPARCHACRVYKIFQRENGHFSIESRQLQHFWANLAEQHIKQFPQDSSFRNLPHHPNRPTESEVIQL